MENELETTIGQILNVDIVLRKKCSDENSSLATFDINTVKSILLDVLNKCQVDFKKRI